jgi:hypothetical protein
VYKEIESNDCFVFVISPDSIKSENTVWTLDHAMKNAKRVIPIVYRDVPFEEVREDIKVLNWLFFREDGDNWGASLKKLFETMDNDIRHVRIHTKLLSMAIKWETEDFEKSGLLVGNDLKSSQLWLSESALGKEPKPTALHMSYIRCSQSLHDTMSKRRLIAFFFLIILTIGIAWPSWGVFFFALVFAHIFVFFSSN